MNNKTRKTFMAFLLLALLVMTVGYSSLIQKLNVNGVSTITSNWQVEIINITEESRTGAVASRNKEWNATEASFEVDLTNPGDKISYAITIKNKGTLDAELDSIDITRSENPAIIFSINNITEGEVIKAKHEKIVYASVEYSNMVETQPSVTLGTFNVKLNFVQALGVAPIDSVLDRSDFVVEKADIAGYPNVLNEAELVRNDLNLYGNWENYDDQGIVKITLPKQYNDVLDDATLTLTANGPTINSTQNYKVKDLLYTSPVEEYQYLYLFVKCYDTSTNQTMRFNIDGTEYEYTLHILGEKGV